MSKPKAASKVRLHTPSSSPPSSRPPDTDIVKDSFAHIKREHLLLRRQVKEFITEHRAASLATINNDGNPHIAVVYCTVTPDLRLYFSTRVEGRKYHNLLENPFVAMAFTNESAVQMVQLSGRASRIENITEEQAVLHELMKIRYEDPSWPPPPMKMFERGISNEIAIVEIIPSELTFADFQASQTGHYKPFFQKVI